MAKNEPDMVAMIAASAALTISGVPFMGPDRRLPRRIYRRRICPQSQAGSPRWPMVGSNLVVAATQDAVMMVESEAKELTEDEMLGAVMFAHDEIRNVIGAIIELAEQAAKDPWTVDLSDNTADMKAKLKDLIGGDIAAAYKLTDKSARSDALNEARAKAKAAFADEGGQTQMVAGKLMKKLEAEIVRGAILRDGQRIDGRKLDQVRPIEAIVGFLPRTHGSSLFTRGETQAICTTTLGTKDSEQMIDGLEGLSYSSFMLHYNFPPYSVGEVGRFGAPGRREVGHGKLAWRALNPVLPEQGRLPLHHPRVVGHHRVQRLVLDGGRCGGGCLSMMDAGVPVKSPGFGHRHGPDP